MTLQQGWDSHQSTEPLTLHLDYALSAKHIHGLAQVSLFPSLDKISVFLLAKEGKILSLPLPCLLGFMIMTKG